MPEIEVIRLAQRGDAAAFERLYRLHSKRVFAVCLRMLRDTAEAEDLTQETFLAVFRRIHGFRGESAFSTWLHRVAFNLVLMHLRKKKLPQTSLDAITESTETTHGLELSGPDLHLNGSVDRVTLERTIDQLPPGLKAVFVLYDIQGYEHHEIADIRGCSTGTSKSQLHKSRQRLRELLRKRQSSGKQGQSHATSRCAVGTFSPGGRVSRPPLHGDKVALVPFERSGDAVIPDLLRQPGDCGGDARTGTEISQLSTQK